MIWNEYEAYVLQVKQIGTSACGPTAVLNILVGYLSCFENDAFICVLSKFLSLIFSLMRYSQFIEKKICMQYFFFNEKHHVDSTPY